MNNQLEREVWLTLSYEEAEKSLNYVSLLCDSFDLMAIAGEDIFARKQQIWPIRCAIGCNLR